METIDIKQNLPCWVWAILCLIPLLSPLQSKGQGRTIERTYISTDRPYYAAGDRVYVSAFCLTPEKEFSSFSAITYLELYSSDGHSVNGKVALQQGRGAGYLDLPSDLPTGNYRLIAYTAVNHNESGYDYSAHSKIISIYNTSSSSRVGGGVTVSSGKPESNVSSPESGLLSVSMGENEEGSLMIFLESGTNASVSVSVFHDEDLPEYDKSSIGTMTGSYTLPTGFSDNAVPEYDGEIIKVKIEPSGPISELIGKDIFIATPGSTSDIYAAQCDEDGTASFFTTDIFGKKDMAIEIKEYDKPFSFSIESPFKGKGSKEGIPSLEISAENEKGISRLGEAMQVASMFDADTLYEYLPTRALPFTGKDNISYILDDYTRFETLREVFIEYLFDINAKRDRSKGVTLSVSCNDSYGRNSYFPDGESLILLDGVPVFDHNLVYGYDPALLRRIDVYPYVYFLGGKVYEGMANFVTFEGNMPSFDFGPEVRIADFQGAGYPIRITGENFPEDSPNLRETIYWNPLMELDKDNSTGIKVNLPAYTGKFRIVVEGIDSEGNPIRKTGTFETE